MSTSHVPSSESTVRPPLAGVDPGQTAPPPTRPARQITRAAPRPRRPQDPVTNVTAVDDRSIDSADALIAAIRSAGPNINVTVHFTREGAPGSVQVTLGSATAN